MRKLVLFFGLVTAGFIIACEDQIGSSQAESNGEEYLIFGTFHGHCLPCENTMYKVTRTDLTFDDMSLFPGLTYQFSKDGQLSTTDFNNSIQLLDLLPSAIKEADKEVYGCPDCADQGGYYLEFIQHGEIKRVILDTSDTEDQSEDMVNFKDAMSVIIQIIGA
ncbi:hypothetical protein [Roseivirga sp.]|uniref:hypothetical protein n=1 Tax=Roseivirga sp. TaxID=1964215 RepID=UPI003B52FF30